MRCYLLLAISISMQAIQAFTLEIPDLPENQLIPKKFTCDGQDISPKISWQKVPGAKSYVLIMHDPDALRAGGFTHWVIKNIPADVTEIPEGVKPEVKIGTRGEQLLNSSGKLGYKGPCPPTGEHRYIFELFALDVDHVDGEDNISVAQRMEGHLMGRPAILMRRYRRPAIKK